MSRVSSAHGVAPISCQSNTCTLVTANKLGVKVLKLIHYVGVVFCIYIVIKKENMELFNIQVVHRLAGINLFSSGHFTQVVQCHS